MTYKQIYAFLQAFQLSFNDIKRIQKFDRKSWLKKVNKCAQSPSSITKYKAKPD